MSWFEKKPKPEPPFKAGEVVRHKAGGPKMVVAYESYGEQCLVEWFDARGRRQEDWVSWYVLTKEQDQ